jgi:hypothetical protein
MEQTVAGLTETNAALAQTVSALQNEAEMLRIDLAKSGVLANLPSRTALNKEEDEDVDVKPSLALISSAAGGWSTSPSLSPSPPPPPQMISGRQRSARGAATFNRVVNL